MSEPISIHIQENLKPDDLKETVIWMFWRRVLKMRNFKPTFRRTEIYRVDGKTYARVSTFFHREKNNAIFAFHNSKSEPLFFTVTIRGSCFRSKDCYNTGEFEDEFKRYFRRKRPILPAGVGLLPEIEH